MRWRAARQVPSVVVAVFVVSSFCALCLVYLPFVVSRPYSCRRSERRVNNSVCILSRLLYPHIPTLGDVALQKSDVLYVHCACVLYLVERMHVLPWVDSVGGSFVCGVSRSLELLTLLFLSFSFSLSFSDHSGHRRRDRRPI